MATETKIYKPGQFVWLNGKKHRVTKATAMTTCKKCSYSKDNSCTNPEIGVCLCFFPDNCYPKPI